MRTARDLVIQTMAKLDQGFALGDRIASAARGGPEGAELALMISEAAIDLELATGVITLLCARLAGRDPGLGAVPTCQDDPVLARQLAGVFAQLAVDGAGLPLDTDTEGATSRAPIIWTDADHELDVVEHLREPGREVVIVGQRDALEEIGETLTAMIPGCPGDRHSFVVRPLRIRLANGNRVLGRTPDLRGLRGLRVTGAWLVGGFDTVAETLEAYRELTRLGRPQHLVDA